MSSKRCLLAKGFCCLDDLAASHSQAAFDFVEIHADVFVQRSHQFVSTGCDPFAQLPEGRFE